VYLDEDANRPDQAADRERSHSLDVDAENAGL